MTDEKEDIVKFVVIILLFILIILAFLFCFNKIYSGNHTKVYDTKFDNTKFDYYNVSLKAKNVYSQMRYIFSTLYPHRPYIKPEEIKIDDLKKLKYTEFYNMDGMTDGKIHYIDKKYIKSPQNKDGINEELAKKPCILMFDKLFFVNSYNTGCKTADFKNPEKSDCWFTVDINGFEGPNKLLDINGNTDLQKLKNQKADGDQFIIIILNDTEQLWPTFPDKYKQLYDGKNF